VLEVGCSVGNIAVAFLGRSPQRYVGVDIDSAAIRLARKRFSRVENFDFYCQDLAELAQRRDRFGYVLVAGVLHHLPDDECLAILRTAAALLEDSGVLAVVEPVVPRPLDPGLCRFYLRHLEHGQYVREHQTLDMLLKSIEGLAITEADSCFVGATPLRIPRCARFGVWRMEKTGKPGLATDSPSITPSK
jgi:SAM-dependent methyltransferase